MISRSERLLSYGILVLFAAVALYPVALILRTALQPDQIGDSGGLHFGNFAAAWEEGHFSSYMRTSVVVAVFVVGLATTLSVLAGYAFGTMSFPGSEVIFYVMLLGIMVPAEALVVPLYFDLRSLGYTDSLVAIVMPQVAQSTAFGTFWMRAYFRTSSREVVEAARLDGAGHWRTLWSVLVPMGRAGDHHDGGARLHVDLERVPDPPGHGHQRGAADRPARAGVLPGSLHLGHRPARRRRHARGPARGRRVPRPAAALHPRHGGRRSEVMAIWAASGPHTDAEAAQKRKWVAGPDRVR